MDNPPFVARNILLHASADREACGPPSRESWCKMYEGPEFRHIRFFLAVAEESNLSKAAAKLHVTQPNVTRAIRQLEDGMQTVLFARGPAGSGLTPRGRAFLPFARQMMEMRAHSVRATSSERSGVALPLRLGYTPFANHRLVVDAMRQFCELVPDSNIEPSSECSGHLVSLILDGSLEAALVTLPVPKDHLHIQKICTEKILVCLRRDDPLAAFEELPAEAVGERIKVIFARVHQPLLYDRLIEKLEDAGVSVSPSAFVSGPSDVQFLVSNRKGLGLIRESTPLPPDLVTRGIAGLSLKATTALICLREQKRPVLPLLGYRLSKMCEEEIPEKKLPARAATAPADGTRSVA